MGRSDFTVIGHRGARGLAPENTLLAFDTALRCGAHMLELDVQRVGDELMVIHDLRLERTTNGRGRVADHDYATLRGLDAGQGQFIPTLAEVLDLVEARVPLNIELKTAGGTAALVAARIRDYLADGWTPDSFLVSSFHLPELYEFRQLLPEVPIGVLLCGVPLDWAAVATELQAQAVNVSEEFADARLIRDAKARGCRVYAYTVNNLDDMFELRDAGVDGVFTDFPDRALAALKSDGGRRPPS